VAANVGGAEMESARAVLALGNAGMRAGKAGVITKRVADDGVVIEFDTWFDDDDRSFDEDES
jgi:hypothetical protein